MYDCSVATEFADWLMAELRLRGWNSSELARRAGIAPSTVSVVLGNQSHPGLEFCVGIARAFGQPPEDVLRLAGLLPSLPPAVAEEREALTLLRGLSPTVRGIVMTILRAVGRTSSSPPLPPVATDQGDVLTTEILEEISRIPDEWKPEILSQARMLSRLAQRPPARIIGAESEEERVPATETDSA